MRLVKKSFAMLVVFALVLSVFGIVATPEKASAGTGRSTTTVNSDAKAVKLSKTKLTFKSPKAKAQTVTIKNVKASNIKDIKISNMWEDWLTIKRKGKNKLVITPKRSSGDIEYGLSVTVEYKKPVDGAYSAYLSFEKVKIKGSSTIKIKTAEDLFNMRAASYTAHRWKYVLANDIDLTGKGMAKQTWQYGSDSYEDIYLDGKGHTIKSDSIIFHSVSGVIKNVVFDMNIDTALSKNDKTTEALKSVVYNSTYGGIAPIVYNNGLIQNCIVKGSIKVLVDQKMEYYGYDGKEITKTSHINVAGLVEENTRSEAVIRQCRSDVDITVTVGDSEEAGFCQIYAGGLVAENYGYDGSGQYASIEECEFAGSVEIKNCHTFHYGGGIQSWGHGYVKDCINRGEVHASEGGTFDWMAGISGDDGKAVERVINVGSADYGLRGRSISDVSLTNGSLPEYKDAYWLKSKSDGFNYMGNAFEVPGTHGITDEELLKESTFAGFDFDKVWKMGANGPELRNLPNY
ncbi:MAG: hypothetical protein ILP10_06410 [Lachnospiraceae bacterium]|nr:hypothetical protein [Lachnospiraceae bacterium]